MQGKMEGVGGRIEMETRPRRGKSCKKPSDINSKMQEVLLQLQQTGFCSSSLVILSLFGRSKAEPQFKHSSRKKNSISFQRVAKFAVFFFSHDETAMRSDPPP